MALFANDYHFLAPQRVDQAVFGVNEDVRMWAYLFNADIPGLPAELGGPFNSFRKSFERRNSDIA